MAIQATIHDQDGDARPVLTTNQGGERPVFVPVAFSEEEALHLLGAARAVIQSATSAGESKAMAPLVHAQVRLAEATDKARAERGEVRDARS